MKRKGRSKIMKRKNDGEVLDAAPQVKKIKPETVLIPAIYAAAGFIFAPGEFIFGSYPFGISLTAAAPGVSNALAALAGSMLGCLRIKGGASHALILPALFVIRMIIGYWLSDSSKRGILKASVSEKNEAYSNEENRFLRMLESCVRITVHCAVTAFRESVYVRMALGSVASIVSGAMFASDGGYAYRDLIGAVISAIVSPIIIYLYSAAFEKDGRFGNGLLTEAGQCALAATAVLSLSTVNIAGYNLGVAAAFAVTVIVSRTRGTLRGTVCGIICGIVLTPAYAPLYAISAIVAGSLWKSSGAAAVMGACVAGITWGIYVSGFNAMTALVPELISVSAVLMPLCALGILPQNKQYHAYERASGAIDPAVPSELKQDATEQKLSDLSDSFSSISKILYNMSEKITMPEIYELYDICAESFNECCTRCGMKHACLEREEKTTSKLKADMASLLRREGRVSASVVPASIAGRCFNMEQIIDTINARCAKKIAEAKVYDRTSIVAADYEAISDMLREAAVTDKSEFECDSEMTSKLLRHIKSAEFKAANIAVYGRRMKKIVAKGVKLSSTSMGAEEIRVMFEKACGIALTTPEFQINGENVIMKMRSRSILTTECGRASVALSEIRRKKRSSPDQGNTKQSSKADTNGETRIFEMGTSHGKNTRRKNISEMCGDVIISFETKDGRMFMLISDGMGSGKEAALTSGVCAVFLERMLTSGAAMDTALKMLNSMIRVRQSECSATVDLMEIDLMTGRAKFVKSGAAPSFVLREGRLFRLQSKTVPIGIVRALDAEMIQFEIEPGDTVIMLSDGVVRSFEDCPWLYDMLCDEEEWLDNPEEMAKKIIRRAIDDGAEDDITAGIVCVKKAG